MRERARWWWAMVVAVLLGLPGCGVLRAQFARESAIERELDRTAIPAPFDDVWAKVTSVEGPAGALAWGPGKHGWKDLGPRKKRTPTEKEETDVWGERVVELTWIEVDGEPVAGGTQVRYVERRMEERYRDGARIGSSESSRRRTDLELELLRMFDAERADAIEAAGEQAVVDAAR